MTLRLRKTKGAGLSQPPLQALLDSASEFVASQAHEYGENTYCNDMPFQYDVGEGMEITIWFLLHPFTWFQLTTVIHGLHLYILDGKRYKAYGFEIGGLESPDGYPWLGWGDIGTSRQAS